MRFRGFTPRVVALWAIAAIVAFGLSFWELMTTDAGRRARGVGSDRTQDDIVELQVIGDADREP